MDPSQPRQLAGDISQSVTSRRSVAVGPPADTETNTAYVRHPAHRLHALDENIPAIEREDVGGVAEAPRFFIDLAARAQEA